MKPLNSIDGHTVPVPWDWWTSDGTRLRVVPDGYLLESGDLDLYVEVQICPSAHIQRVPSGRSYLMRPDDVPGLVAGLTDRTAWTTPGTGEGLTVRPEGDGMRLVYALYAQGNLRDYSMVVPEEQRLPLVSALSSALELTRAWVEAV
ncbi:hypothetical protein ABZX85_23075 [Streptomyces sp. NPDC004539]|uniref:hypothetical protein n=1 Tax=Streptomyces sp. NPDC004539 TaxID=3154280 RepID=UPI0033B30359